VAGVPATTTEYRRHGRSRPCHGTPAAKIESLAISRFDPANFGLFVREHLPGERKNKAISSSCSFVSSCLRGNYFASAGMSYVLKPGPKLDIVATNELKDPNKAASPAVTEGRIYLRGVNLLYCIGKQPQACTGGT
jgi:hypothetical protein